MEVIDDHWCTVFFLGILPHTLPSTDKNSSSSSLTHTLYTKKGHSSKKKILNSKNLSKPVVLKFLELSFIVWSLNHIDTHLYVFS